MRGLIVAAMLASCSDAPPPPTPPATPAARVPADAFARVEPDVPPPSPRERLLARNPFVERGGVRLLATQVTPAEYELVLGKPPEGAGPTQPEAIAFCAGIDAHLPTSDELERVEPVGSEWTSTVEGKLAVLRGAGTPRRKPLTERSAAIGFRCADGPPVAGRLDARLEAKLAEVKKPRAPEPAIPGTLDGPTIRGVVLTQMAAIKACYGREVEAGQPTLEGRVDLEFVIGKTGSVVRVKATGMGPVGDCIVPIIRRLKFPAPSNNGTVTVNYPFDFSPE